MSDTPKGTAMGALPCVHFPHCFCWMKARGYCQAREDDKKGAPANA